MQQHHQLDDGGSGGLAISKANASVGSIIIQLPSTSANQMSNQAHHQTSVTSQAYLSNRNGAQHQATTGSHWAGTNLRDTIQSRPNETNTASVQYSNCHHQAATRDLMLQHQQNHKHRYWRRDHVDNSSRANPTSRLLGPDQQATTNTTTTTTTTTLDTTTASVTTTTRTLRTTTTSLSSSNESDNISEESSPPPPNYHEIPGIVPSYHGRTSGPPPAYDDVVNPNAPPPSYQSLFGQVREARKSSNGLVDLLRQLFLVLIGTIGCTMIIGFLLLIPITMIFVGVFYINECRAENIPSFLVVGGFVWIIKNMLNCYNQFKKDSSTVNRPPPRRASHLAVAAGQPSDSSTLAPNTASPSTTIMTPNHHLQEAAALSVTVATTSLQQDTEAAIPVATTSTTRPIGNTTRVGQTNQSSHGSTMTSNNNSSTNQRHARQPQMIGLTSDKCESILNYFLIVWFLAGCIVVYRIYEPDYENPLSLSYCNRTVYLYAFWLMTSAFIIIAIVLSCLCCLMASSLMSCSHGR